MATENIEDVEDLDNIKYVRPAAITLISLWLFFGVLTSVWLIVKGYGASFTANTVLFTVGGIVSLVCGVGFWLMKKWALYIYAAYGLITQVVLLVLGRWNLFSLFYFAVVIYFGYKYRSEMS